MSKTSELEARVAELEAIIAANIKARDGIQDRVNDATNDLLMIVWSLESIQAGFNPSEHDWLHVMRDVTKAIFHVRCMDALLGDINGP